MTFGSVRPLTINDTEFHKIASLAKREFGLNLMEGKKSLIASRLSRRLKAIGLQTISEYIDHVEKNDDPSEKNHLITALTTNVTSFFREPHHFSYLSDYIDDSMTTKNAERRFRFWSAGCSTGQEAYSMAMTISNKLKDYSLHNTKILATDIDQSVLEIAKSGNYENDVLDSIPPQYQTSVRQFREKDIFSIDPEIRNMVTFAQLNLIDDWPVKGPFDAIFCRNVTIYFDADTQKRLWKKFSDLLTVGGLLCIGHSERVTGPATDILDNTGVTSYRKKRL